MGVFGDEEAGEGVANRSLLGARELAPGGPDASLVMVPMSKADVIAGEKRRSRSPHAERSGRLERRHQLAVIGLDTAGRPAPQPAT